MIWCACSRGPLVNPARAACRRERTGEAGDESRRLNGYGFTDASRQTVHIPIDRAMSLIAERGLPGWAR